MVTPQELQKLAVVAIQVSLEVMQDSEVLVLAEELPAELMGMAGLVELVILLVKLEDGETDGVVEVEALLKMLVESAGLQILMMVVLAETGRVILYVQRDIQLPLLRPRQALVETKELQERQGIMAAAVAVLEAEHMQTQLAGTAEVLALVEGVVAMVLVLVVMVRLVMQTFIFFLLLLPLLVSLEVKEGEEVEIRAVQVVRGRAAWLQMGLEMALAKQGSMVLVLKVQQVEQVETAATVVEQQDFV
tara:strand:- start:21 stop:761 length:741 start_codon:yes stop_codon:yes gene_type:complete